MCAQAVDCSQCQHAWAVVFSCRHLCHRDTVIVKRTEKEFGNCLQYYAAFLECKKDVAMMRAIFPAQATQFDDLTVVPSPGLQNCSCNTNRSLS